MGWYLVQSSIFCLVVGSNIHWGWTPNAYVAAVLGAVAALCVTGVANEIGDIVRRWRRRPPPLPR
jgi:hypothetical protein